jgi:cytochrome c
MLMLRPARVQAEDADVYKNMWRGDKTMGSIHHRSYFVFKNIDLKNVRSVTCLYSSAQHEATLEIHAGSVKGPVVSIINYKKTSSWDDYKTVSAPVTDPGGVNDLYFVFTKETPPNRDLCDIDWIEFKK